MDLKESILSEQEKSIVIQKITDVSIRAKQFCSVVALNSTELYICFKSHQFLVNFAYALSAAFSSANFNVLPLPVVNTSPSTRQID